MTRIRMKKVTRVERMTIKINVFLYGLGVAIWVYYIRLAEFGGLE